VRRRKPLAPRTTRRGDYWTDRAEEQRARYDALDDAVKAGLEALWHEDRPQDEVEVEYDARLAAWDV
jgi:hypothetical protein